jgi:hypothetical protein
LRRGKGDLHYWHETRWVLLSDPPGNMASSMLFKTQEEAEKTKSLWESKGRKHLIILAPANVAEED